MPTYDYECQSCEHTFELFQSITEPKKKKCPQCNRNTLRRLFGTGAALLFKGSGFYQTDYRSESYKKGAEADKKSADGGSSKASDSKASDSKASDSKPAEAKAGDSRSGESRAERPARGTDKPGRKKLSGASA